MSRSGGTLVVTLLDAHPLIAMSYELYPNLLVSQQEPPIGTAQLLEVVKKARDDRHLARLISDRNLRTFAIRCRRGGVDHTVLAAILEEFFAEGGEFSDPEARLRFMEKCCLHKMRSEGKPKSRLG